MMVCSILATWLRVFGIFMVIKTFSNLLLTVIKMLESAKTFMIILGLYLTIMAVIFFTLFQENSITYSNFIFTIRTLFDGMMGAFSYNMPDPLLNKLHTLLLYLHIYIANIFMLNYLVAILATVYEDQLEIGDFTYKCCKYWYIERYLIAFKDTWGYTELIVHAPPTNVFQIFLLPFIFDKQKMKKWAFRYSMIVFWVENIYFIIEFFISEMLLVPYNYLRILFQTLKLSGFKDFYLVIFWMLFGFFYLLFYGVTMDIYYFIKILRNYQLDDDLKTQMEDEDEANDKIIIYNEMIYVMKSILYIF